MQATTALSAIIFGCGLFVSTGTIAQAADNQPPEITFDGGQLYESCLMDGGTAKQGKKTFSCSHDGKTTTCDKNPDDKDTACTTEKDRARYTIVNNFNFDTNMRVVANR